MLPQHIIFAIFTALLTQGKIAAAIPQVDFQANEERLDGTAEYNHIAARDWTSEAKIRNTGIDVGPLTTTADDVPIVIRAPTDCDPAVSNLANGVQPRNIDDYIDWMTKLNTAITLSAQVWILLPVSVLGVGFLAIPSNRRTTFFAWVSHIARGVCGRAESPIREGPDQHDEENGIEMNNRLEAVSGAGGDVGGIPARQLMLAASGHNNE